MPPKKKTKVAGADDEVAAVEAARQVHQQEDIVAIILGWLRVEEIMGKRRVCKKWKEAARKMIVPLSEFVVNSLKGYNAMNVMTRALPNLQRICLAGVGNRHKYSDGEDPNESMAAALTANYTTHDIGIISNFSKLRDFAIIGSPLNGRYPVLFNFPLLQRLSINYCKDLKWDLDMLSGLPLLRELDCSYNELYMTGNINSLRVLKDTLEKVTIKNCLRVEGNFMDLADFPHLKELDLYDTAVTGDIRDIGDFSSLKQIILPKTVYGGRGYKLQRLSDAPDFMSALQQLKKQRPVLKLKDWYGELSEDSPDRYRSVMIDTPPFRIRLVEAGSRVGYRWESQFGKPCEVIWLDPEPDSESSDYEMYTEKLRKIENWVHTDTLYRGFHQPPIEEEYQRLLEGRQDLAYAF